MDNITKINLIVGDIRAFVERLQERFFAKETTTKISVVIRTPGKPDVELVYGNDRDFDEIIATVTRTKKRMPRVS